jgi:hypothetical protein
VKLPVPLSQQLAAFHASQVAYHHRTAREHARHGHHGAALRHQQAAEAHEAAMSAPFDEKVTRPAMRASAIADEASQRVGVRPRLPWPAKPGRRKR